MVNLIKANNINPSSNLQNLQTRDLQTREMDNKDHNIEATHKKSFSLDNNEWSVILEKYVEKPKQISMRKIQIFKWIFQKGVMDFAKMSDLPEELRKSLLDNYVINFPKIKEKQISKDGTRKYLLVLQDGGQIETVYLPDVGRSGSICISSQIGCILTCKFCHTGTQDYIRNLTINEILAQIIVVKYDLNDFSKQENKLISNIVFMGMGEPLYNIDNVCEAINIISHKDGFNIAQRRITVSTSGVVPKIAELGERSKAILAISLHSPRNEIRSKIIPLNKKYPLEDLIAECRKYPNLGKNRRITFEYIMLDGINDDIKDAVLLTKLIQAIPAKINLIPFNKWPGSNFSTSPDKKIKIFNDRLKKSGLQSSIRKARGEDIMAACGQLKSASVKVSKSIKQKALLAKNSQ